MHCVGRRYEDVRAKNQLVVFDTADDVSDTTEDGNTIAFISHQWKGVFMPHPDPTNSDYTTVVSGLQSLIESKGLNPKKLLVWIGV